MALILPHFFAPETGSSTSSSVVLRIVSGRLSIQPNLLLR